MRVLAQDAAKSVASDDSLGRVGCAGLVVWKYGDLTTNLSAAKSEGKCLKARVPLSFDGALHALDFYRKTC